MINQELYTFILMYNEEAFVMQIKENNLNDAVLSWGKAISANKLLKNLHKQLPADLALIQPLEIENTKNVWFFWFKYNRKHGWLHIIKTQPALRGL
jgi:hypothetical protein